MSSSIPHSAFRIPHSYLSRSEEQTKALAADLARRLHGGEVIFLSGDFGSGKTVFVKGLAAALGVDPTSVTSPSFTLVQSYFGSLTVHHVDLYRLENQEGIAELAMEDLVSPSSVLVIEWAQHWHSPSLEPSYRVDFSHETPQTRRITIDEAGGRS